MVYIIILGLVFCNAFKVVDLIDEHKWIGGRIGFIIKYLCAFLVILAVHFTIKFDPNFIYHFLPLFIFWILKNKMEYPSHVFIMFSCGIILGHNFTFSLFGAILMIGLLIAYILFDYLINTFKNSSLIQFILYKRLGRFYIIAFFLSLFLNDYLIFVHSLVGLLSMELVRYLIRRQIIVIYK